MTTPEPCAGLLPRIAHLNHAGLIHGPHALPHDQDAPLPPGQTIIPRTPVDGSRPAVAVSQRKEVSSGGGE